VHTLQAPSGLHKACTVQGMYTFQELTFAITCTAHLVVDPRSHYSPKPNTSLTTCRNTGHQALVIRVSCSSPVGTLANTIALSSSSRGSLRLPPHTPHTRKNPWLRAWLHGRTSEGASSQSKGAPWAYRRVGRQHGHAFEAYAWSKFILTFEQNKALTTLSLSDPASRESAHHLPRPASHRIRRRPDPGAREQPRKEGPLTRCVHSYRMCASICSSSMGRMSRLPTAGVGGGWGSSTLSRASAFWELVSHSAEGSPTASSNSSPASSKASACSVGGWEDGTSPLGLAAVHRNGKETHGLEDGFVKREGGGASVLDKGQNATSELASCLLHLQALECLPSISKSPCADAAQEAQ